ncbi:DNA gyrase inhibitor YacG [Rhizobium alvei]|uniref:DNA gyrase inhibitor YacG n=1 Tax=Rhizobium alvei TaxID=1132659 RepID=A0ABT8YMC3_9HYPH|nr:DNA gyrase inhibitor YacG [Rhizobium alvei]MDO6964375.1 DNA gyrase inhibitor YacG [Rhizobium alvei]
MERGRCVVTATVEPLRKARPCPECGRPSTRESYPFCSERCRNLDLSRWLKGSYAIPVADDEALAESESVRPERGDD